MAVFIGVCWRLIATVFVAFTATVWFDIGVYLVGVAHPVAGFGVILFTSCYVTYIYWGLWARWFYDYIGKEDIE